MKVLQLTWFLLCYDVDGLIKTPSLYWQQKKFMEPPPPLKMRFYPNKWQGVIISLQTGGQGHQTSIHTPTLTPTHKHTQVSRTLVFPLFDLIITDKRTNRRMDRWTKPLIGLRVSNYKGQVCSIRALDEAVNYQNFVWGILGFRIDFCCSQRGKIT